MTNNIEHLVGYQLVRPDPRLGQAWDFPFQWIPSVGRALQQMTPAVLNQANYATHQIVSSEIDTVWLLLWDAADELRRL